MGLRSKIKGKLKSALGVSNDKEKTEPAPNKHMVSISQDTGSGNLRGSGDQDEVPWYLKYDDADGWESTNAKNSDVDDD